MEDDNIEGWIKDFITYDPLTQLFTAWDETQTEVLDEFHTEEEAADAVRAHIEEQEQD